MEKGAHDKIVKYKDDISLYVDSKRDELIGISEDIYNNPELAFKERYASKRLSDYLKREGFLVTHPYGGLDTAFDATYIHNGGGYEVVIMAEYDALPNGHACGHNIIASSAIGAGIATKHLLEKNNISATIRVVGTPAEEHGGGKIILQENGAFDNTDIVLLLHPTTGISKVAGRCKSSYTIKAEYTGVLSSAISRPEQGVNATEGSVLAFQNLATALKYLPNDVSIMPFITTKNINDGLLPVKSEIEVVITAFEDISLERAREDVLRILEASATMTKTQVDIIEESGYLGRVINETVGTVLHGNMLYYGEPMQEGFIDDNGFEDFGNVNRVVPGAMVYPTLLSTKKVSNHTDAFLQLANSQKSKEVVLLGSKVMASTAIELLLDESLIKKAREEI